MCRHPRRSIPLWLRVLLVCLLCAGFFTPGTAHAQENEPWWDAAAEESRDEFNAVKDTLSETIAELDELQTQINEFEDLARATLSGDELDSALNAINQARTSLDDKLEVMRLADTRLTSVGAAIDGLFDLRDITNTALARRGGPLATSMSLLGEAMTRYGGNVPWVGDFITYYGEAVTGLLDATDQLATAIDSNVRQGTLSGLGIDDPMIQAIRDQFGDDFLASHTFGPVGPPYLYEDYGRPDADLTLIWNPNTQTWTRVDRAASDITDLYRSYVLANGRPSPDQLIALATVGYDGAKARLAAGSDAFALLDSLAGPVSNFIFANIDRQSDYTLSEFLRDPALFIARFAHDQDANRTVLEWMRAMYREARQRGADDVVDRLQAWADKHGIELAPQPELEATNSIVILFDASGSMGDNGKITAAKRAARNVLTRLEADTQVALIVFYDCGSIVVEQPFTTDAEAVLEKVEAILPSGSTPLAEAITFARGYIQDELDGDSARLVILSDGMETCGGDPVSAAQP